MQQRVQFSAVIPSYNRATLVGRAIKSALGQEHAPEEIIVVDDGSTDETQRVVASFGAKVRYLYQSNSGVSAARNTGARQAKYEWIAFLDSDDYWSSRHLKHIAEAINGTRGEAALYFADVAMGWEQGRTYWDQCGFSVNGEWELKRDASDWAMMRVQPMMTPASAVSRTTFLELGGLSEQIRTREDTLLFFKLAFLYPVCAVSGVGTVVNGDDTIRLTQVYDSRSLVYCSASIFLYRELLATLTTIGHERRQYLKDCLSAAFFSMGRVLLSRGKYFHAVAGLARSWRTSPPVFARELFGSAVRRATEGDYAAVADTSRTAGS